MAYSEKVIEHYNNPQNVGTLDKNKSTVGTGLVGAPESNCRYMVANRNWRNNDF